MKVLPKGTEVTVEQVADLFTKYQGAIATATIHVGKFGDTQQFDMKDGGALYLKPNQYKEVA